ncbi:MAG: O-antigen ligase family protein [Candidatus Omnitrophota bacterium]|nr:O-antigen ligase family protein [Candidatus Omnitrophota bacterium]MDZ4241384.1 O-antigen ligase family protein [Candidatus Omnitrophota bacterium]
MTKSILRKQTPPSGPVWALPYNVLTVIGIFCYLYSLFTSNFAELHVKPAFLNFPIFIGEFLLLVCLVLTAIHVNGSPRRPGPLVLAAVLGYAGWVLVKALHGYACFGPLAFRNAALFYYPLFALICYWSYEPAFFETFMRRFLLIFLLVNLVFMKVGDYYIYPYIGLIAAILPGLKKRWIKIAVIMFLVFFILHHRLLWTGSRSHLIGIFISLLFLLSFVFWGVLPLSRRYKVVGIFTGILIVGIGMVFFMDKSALRSMTGIEQIRTQFAEHDREIAHQQAAFEAVELPVQLYNENQDNPFRLLMARGEKETANPWNSTIEETQVQQEKERLMQVVSNYFVDRVRDTTSNLYVTSADQFKSETLGLYDAQSAKSWETAEIAMRDEASTTRDKAIRDFRDKARKTADEALRSLEEESMRILARAGESLARERQFLGSELNADVQLQVESLFGQTKESLERQKDHILDSARMSFQKYFELLEKDITERFEQKLTDVVQAVRQGVDAVTLSAEEDLQTSLEKESDKNFDRFVAGLESRRKDVVLKVSLQQADRSLEVAVNNILFRLFIWRDMTREFVRENKWLTGMNFGKPQRSPSIEILGWASVEWYRDGWITPHNSFLHMIYRGGLMGFALAGGLVVVLAGLTAAFLRRKSIVGGLLVSVLIYWFMLAQTLVFLELPYTAITFWSLLGITAAYARPLTGKKTATVGA